MEKHKRCDECGRGRQKCEHPTCPHFSITGHVKGRGRCPYHWNVDAFGREWADKVRATTDGRQ